MHNLCVLPVETILMLDHKGSEDKWDNYLCRLFLPSLATFRVEGGLFIVLFMHTLETKLPVHLFKRSITSLLSCRVVACVCFCASIEHLHANAFLSLNAAH